MREKLYLVLKGLETLMYAWSYTKYFHLINLNLKLELFAKAHFSLPVILLGAMYEKLAGR